MTVDATPSANARPTASPINGIGISLGVAGGSLTSDELERLLGNRTLPDRLRELAVGWPSRLGTTTHLRLDDPRRGPRSEPQVHLADDEPGVADVDAVVVPVRIALALEVEAIERVAAVTSNPMCLRSKRTPAYSRISR